MEETKTVDMTESVTKITTMGIKTIKTAEEIAISVAVPMIVMQFCPKNAKIWTKAAFALTGAAISGILAKMNNERIMEALAKMAESVMTVVEEEDEDGDD